MIKISKLRILKLELNKSLSNFRIEARLLLNWTNKSARTVLEKLEVVLTQCQINSKQFQVTQELEA